MHTYHELGMVLAGFNTLLYLIFTATVFPHLLIHKLIFGVHMSPGSHAGLGV
jgi:hypothetical protein